MAKPRWIILADADGGVDRLAFGSVLWDVVVLEPGLPVMVQRFDELRRLHAGGRFAGVEISVPAKLRADLLAEWLARAIDARIYRTAAGFERARERRRIEAASQREAALAWARLDALRLTRSPAPMQLPAPC